MIRRTLIGMAALFSASLFGQRALAAGCTLSFVDLPVTMSGQRATIPVKINGAPAVLQVDSGDFYSFIAAPSAAALHLPLRAAPETMDVIRGVGGDAEIYKTTINALTIGGSVLPQLDFIVGGGGLGDGVDGLLGQNILARGDVEYDLGHGVMRLAHPTGCGDKMLAYWDKTDPYSVLNIGAISQDADLTTSSVMVNGITMRAMFDTGASTSFLTLAAAKRAGIDPHDPGVVPAGASGGIGRKRVNTWIAPVKSFKIGDEEIRNTHIRIGDSTALNRDMLIGADFFLSHHVYVANSQRKLYFTYNGGPVFNLTVDTPSGSRTGQTSEAAGEASGPAEDGSPEPTDAAGFSRRGAAYLSRRDLPHAIADLTRAIALAPAEPNYPYQRALAYLENRQTDLAAADLDHAIALKPDYLSALATRARLHLARKEKSLALADLDAADRAAAKPANVRLQLANLYLQAENPARAVNQLDLWIGSHADDSQKAEALGARCWAKGLAGADLKGALADCNQSLELAPKSAGVLDSRGLARLRLGELDKSIADYDAALSLNPKVAWSLYGRGLAKLKKGEKNEGDADIAAAVALKPRLPDEAKGYGIAP